MRKTEANNAAVNLSANRNGRPRANENLNRQESDPSSSGAALNKTNGNNGNGGGSSVVTPLAPKPTNQQLGELYTNCVKLLNENVNFTTKIKFSFENI